MLLFLFLPQIMNGTLANQYYLGAAFWVGLIIYCLLNILRARDSRKRTAQRWTTLGTEGCRGKRNMSRGTPQKILLSIGWLGIYVALSILWTLVKGHVYSEIAAIRTDDPRAIAAFFAALIMIVKLGLLLPFWLIWRNPSGTFAEPEKHTVSTPMKPSLLKGSVSGAVAGFICFITVGFLGTWSPKIAGSR